MIRVHDLHFSYPGEIPALRSVDLEIAPGERLAIIGANGSGKTTLGRCLNGLLLPASGEVMVDDLSTRDPQSLFEIRRRVGMVFQTPDDQLVSTTVETEIAFGLENLSVPYEEMHARVEEALRLFDLANYRQHPPHRLSGGEKQRVAIAAAVALRPAYLVLDEPTALLDPLNRRMVDDLLYSLPEDHGIATIHITQIPEEAARADRLLVMHRGELIYDTTPDALFAAPQTLTDLGLGVPFACALRHRFSRHGLSAVDRLPANPDIATLARTVHAAGLDPQSSPLSPSPPATAPNKLSTRDLEYVYDRGLPTAHKGLDRLDIDVPEGSIVALIGPSGSGKTTLAQHFNGLLRPNRGSVLLDGEDIWEQDLPQIRRRIGLVFQFPELQLFEESVERDIAFGPENLRFPPERIERQITRSLETVGLPREEFGRRSPLSLSGGEKRRVALAGVLAMDPEVLILDEPTAGLDPRATEAMCQVFARLQERGTTQVLITHDMDIVARLATHVVVLQKGKVHLKGPVREILSHPDFTTHSGLEPPASIRFSAALNALGSRIPGNLLTLDEIVAFLIPIERTANPDNPGDAHPPSISK